MSDIDERFNNLDKVLGNTQDHRTVLITKAMAAVNDMDISPNDESSKMLEAKLGVISLADSLLKSREDATMKHVKLAITKKDGETNEKNSQVIADLMKRITPSQFNIPAPLTPGPIELGSLAVDGAELGITDGELEIGNHKLEDI